MEYTIKVVFKQLSKDFDWALILNLILEKGNPKLIRVKFQGKVVLFAEVEGDLDSVNRVVGSLQRFPGVCEAKIETHPHWD